MNAVVKSVEPGSPAERCGIRSGDILLSINGHKIADVLDYKFYSYEAKLIVEVHRKRVKKIKLKKREGEDPGINFETYLMDKPRSCANKCIFCFVDQLPKGVRETLNFKDDDARLSFLLGNYITLTNLSPRELQRILDLHISPINVSVQTTNPELRDMMLGSKRAGKSLDAMYRMAEAGIRLNCQVVVCPDVNDGAELERTLRDLINLWPSVSSISVVPVGLTKHREGLYPLKPVERKEAREIIGIVDFFGEKALKECGSRIVFSADELYLKAEYPIPDTEYYEDYPQIENGVGLLRSFYDEFVEELEFLPKNARMKNFSLATGMAAANFIAELIDLAAQKCNNGKYRIYSIKNEFFGETVDVAGLVAGNDLVSQLKDKELFGELLIPGVMLRDGGDVFIDDLSFEQAKELLGVEIITVGSSGSDLAYAIFDTDDETDSSI